MKMPLYLKNRLCLRKVNHSASNQKKAMRNLLFLLFMLTQMCMEQPSLIRVYYVSICVLTSNSENLIIFLNS